MRLYSSPLFLVFWVEYSLIFNFSYFYINIPKTVEFLLNISITTYYEILYVVAFTLGNFECCIFYVLSYLIYELFRNIFFNFQKHSFYFIICFLLLCMCSLWNVLRPLLECSPMSLVVNVPCIWKDSNIPSLLGWRFSIYLLN